MYGKNLLDGTNSEHVHVEVEGWLAVMDALTRFVDELDQQTQNKARSLIQAAESSLVPCKAKGKSFSDPSVVVAQRAVRDVLHLFPDRVTLVDSVFFIKVAGASIESVLDRVEDLDAEEKLSKEERQQIVGALESTIASFDSKLDEMESELENPEVDDGGEVD